MALSNATELTTPAEARPHNAPPAVNLEPDTRQLFLDDQHIASMPGLTRAWHAATKYPANPILRPTEYEKSCQVFGTILHLPEEKRYQLWYLMRPWPVDPAAKGYVIGGRMRPVHATMVSYAESKDGIRWQRPALGLVDFDRFPNNNLTNMGRENPEGPGIWYDPKEPDPNRRYRAFFWEHTVPVEGSPPPQNEAADGMWMAFSKDGKSWTSYEKNPVMTDGSDTGQQLVWDARIRKWVAFGRMGGVGRRVSRTESEDSLHWSPAKLVFDGDADDGAGVQIYGMGIGLYEGFYIGTAWVWRVEGDGTMDARLATSRDGISWHRPPKEQRDFIPNGPSGSWDAGIIYTASGLVVHDDKVRIYYCGCTGRHPSPRVKREAEPNYRYSLGVAEVRRDGFASLDAGEAEGALLTKPFVLPEGALRLNADAREGQVTVTVCDAEGQPLRGFERSRPVTGNQFKAVVRWERANLNTLRGKTVRLRIAAQRAKLYSYWFAK